MKYLVVFEKSKNGYGAYAPDLPGLGVVGRTLTETRRLIEEGIELYIEETQRRGDAVPRASASAIEYEVSLPAARHTKTVTGSMPSKRSQKRIATHA